MTTVEKEFIGTQRVTVHTIDRLQFAGCGNTSLFITEKSLFIKQSSGGDTFEHLFVNFTVTPFTKSGFLAVAATVSFYFRFCAAKNGLFP